MAGEMENEIIRDVNGNERIRFITEHWKWSMLIIVILATFLAYAVNTENDEKLITQNIENVEEDHNDPRKLALENSALFGGDMIVNVIYAEEIIFTNGVLDQKYRWPGYPGSGKIPFIIDSHLNEHSDLIKAAMEQYHENTCIRFVERTTEKEYVRIFSGSGCYSAVGRNQSQPQPQPLSLGEGCRNIGTILHELGHVIGLFHEQNRSDRDDYIDIHLENVQRFLWPNFRKVHYSELLLLNGFDYDSIMIYGNKAFSKNGKDTMSAKNGQKLTSPYAKSGLNKSDIERVNLLYKCKNKN